MIDVPPLQYQLQSEDLVMAKFASLIEIHGTRTGEIKPGTDGYNGKLTFEKQVFESTSALIRKWVRRFTPAQLQSSVDLEQINNDVLQNAMLRFQSVPFIAPDFPMDAFRRYCFVLSKHLARNALRNALRKKRTFKRATNSGFDLAALADCSDICFPARSVELTDLRNAIERVLDPLQVIVFERRLTGMSNREISVELGISLRTVEAVRAKIQKMAQRFTA